MGHDTELDPWRRDVAGFVEENLPARPARVLEVGCGDGWLCYRLAAAGYAMLGVDPHAPEGQLFARAGLEDLEVSKPFDAVVAVLSLHHVSDIGGAVDRIADVLRPGGTVVVVEFAWDRFDDDTARWCLERLPGELEDHSWLQHRCAELRRRLIAGEPLRATEHFRRWAAEHRFHSSAQVLQQLRSRFCEHLFAWSPYLYPELENVTASEERAAIDAEQIRPTGFRFVAAARA